MKRIDRRLSNGMRVILVHKEDFVQSFGMIGIPAGGNTLFQADKLAEKAAHEYPSGVAHFLEHQMFYLNGQDVTQALADARAGSNAYTSLDRTCYYIWTSDDPIRPYELLIDFVQNLEITEQTVNKERGIILSEYAMYNQQPEARILKEAMNALYHQHPINRDILGSQKDIENMDPEDLEHFYNSYYDPGHLVFVGITGRDIEPIFEHIKEYEKKYLSNHNQASTFFYPEPEEVVSETFEDEMDISEPHVALAIKIKPAETIQDAYLLDLIYTIWLDSLFSPLNEDFSQWLQQGIATQSLYSEVDISPDHGYILIGSQSENPELFFQTMEKIIDDQQQVPQKVFEALKNVEIASTLRSQEQFEILASDLIQCAFDELEYEKLLELTQNLSFDTFRKQLDHTDFSHRSRLVLNPKKERETDGQLA